MSNTFTANQILSGSWAEIWVDGKLWAECSAITAKITQNRTDVQMGIDVNSKLVGLKGEGTVTVHHVYTTDVNLFLNMFKGKDRLIQIIAKVADPDAVDGQVERWAFNDAIFTDIPLLSMTNGEAAKREYPFQFPATKAVNMDAVRAK
ncbi:MAG: phage tail tube protein [Christensenellaceae bacterium]